MAADVADSEAKRRVASAKYFERRECRRWRYAADRQRRPGLAEGGSGCLIVDSSAGQQQVREK